MELLNNQIPPTGYLDLLGGWATLGLQAGEVGIYAHNTLRQIRARVTEPETLELGFFFRSPG